MAIRRTREQKQRIEARREEGLNFSWRPAETVAVKTPKVARGAGRPAPDTSYLRQDLTRTALAVVLASLVLFLAWYLG